MREGLETPGKLAKRPACDPLGPFGRVTHDEHGLAKAWRLFLDPARIGENKVACRHEIVKIDDFQGLDDAQTIEAV